MYPVQLFIWTFSFYNEYVENRIFLRSVQLTNSKELYRISWVCTLNLVNYNPLYIRHSFSMFPWSPYPLWLLAVQTRRLNNPCEGPFCRPANALAVRSDQLACKMSSVEKNKTYLYFIIIFLRSHRNTYFLSIQIWFKGVPWIPYSFVFVPFFSIFSTLYYFFFPNHTLLTVFCFYLRRHNIRNDKHIIFSSVQLFLFKAYIILFLLIINYELGTT